MRLPVHPSHPATESILGLTDTGLTEALTRIGAEAYRARQVSEWIFRRGAASFDDMSNLPKSLRAALAARYHVFESQVARVAKSNDGTRKLLLRWADAQTSECVLIPDGRRRTACVSTQVGCPVGCVFCASGLDGVVRNLSAGQIVEQVMRVRALCTDESRLSNVVFMGLGEPLANYEHTLAAVRLINAPDGVNVGARRITVSTVGLPRQIRRLADEELQITLALSLHAPTDELRGSLVPWADRVPIKDLVDAVRYYFERTGREVTLEYVLLGGINDAPAQAEQLAGICRTIRANVNLICYNPVPGLPYLRPTDEAAQRFVQVLRGKGVNTHLRRSRGTDIEGACGQLRRRPAGGEAGSPE